MSLPDNLLDPLDDEPECTGDVYSCRCAECVAEWVDTYADAKCDEMKEKDHAY